MQKYQPMLHSYIDSNENSVLNKDSILVDVTTHRIPQENQGLNSSNESVEQNPSASLIVPQKRTKRRASTRGERERYLKHRYSMPNDVSIKSNSGKYFK